MASRQNNVQHKSAEDFRRLPIEAATRKLGGQEEADKILGQWETHRRAEKDSDRRKREADGFLRGVFLSHKLSREETMTFFKVGRYRFERLRDLDPSLPPPKKRPPAHKVTAEEKELVRVFMKAQPTEPGYPCHHRSTPVYLEDPNTTMTHLHNKYKLECKDRAVRVLSHFTFRKIVKYLLPTLHLGRNKIDTCNSCFSMELQIKDPETSEELRQELIAAKELHLNDAIKQKRAINNLVKSVKQETAPGDPPLKEEPIYVPECFNNPYDRINRPFVVDHEDGTVGVDDSIDPEQNDFLGHLFDGDDDINDEDTEHGLAEASNENETAPRKLRVNIQDFGSGIPLPRYGANQPNHDYYASNLTLHNMNFVDCATGETKIAYFDERQAGKDGNSVCSLRMHNSRQYVLENKDNLPTAECKVMDNCCGQNKSNQTHQFSMLNSLILFPDGVTDIYFRVGHSHNQSDMKTAHANKGLDKKNLYTPDEVAFEVNRIKGLKAEVLDDRQVVFFDWKAFLDKHFPKMDPGFTSYFFFEFKDGIVSYKDLLDDGTFVTVKTKVFSPDPATLRKIVLRELFNLNDTSNVIEICKAKICLPQLPQKRLSQKKVDNMKTLYQQIPRSKRWFYPEGDSVRDDPHTDLRLRAAQMGRIGVAVPQPLGDEIGDTEEGVADRDLRRNIVDGDIVDTAAAAADRSVSNVRRLGRPPKVTRIVAERNQPAIHMFLLKQNPNNNRQGEKNKNDSESNSERNDEVEIVDESSSDSEIDCPQKKTGRFQYSDSDSEDEVNEDNADDTIGDVEGSNKAEQYSIDVNDNGGKIIMKLRKQ